MDCSAVRVLWLCNCLSYVDGRVGMTYFLNIADLCFTLYAIQCGIPEANPLMQTTAVMVFYKVVVIGVLCWWLHRRSEPIAIYGLKMLAAVYAVVNIFHVYNIFLG